MAVWTGYSNRLTPVLDNGMQVATDVYRQMMLYLYQIIIIPVIRTGHNQ